MVVRKAKEGSFSIHSNGVVKTYEISRGDLCEGWLYPWFKVAVSAVDSKGTVPHRSQRRGTDSGDTHKTLHRELKKF